LRGWLDFFCFCAMFFIFFLLNWIEMVKGGCAKEQPPFLTNETRKGAQGYLPAPLKVSLFTFR